MTFRVWAMHVIMMAFTADIFLLQYTLLLEIEQAAFRSLLVNSVIAGL